MAHYFDEIETAGVGREQMVARRGPDAWGKARILNGSRERAAGYVRELEARLDRCRIASERDRLERALEEARDDAARVDDLIADFNGGHGDETGIELRRLPAEVCRPVDGFDFDDF